VWRFPHEEPTITPSVALTPDEISLLNRPRPRRVRFTREANRRRVRAFRAQLLLVAAVTAFSQFYLPTVYRTSLSGAGWGVLFTFFGVVFAIYWMAREFSPWRSRDLLERGRVVVGSVIRRAEVAAEDGTGARTFQVVYAFEWSRAGVTTASATVSRDLYAEWTLDAPVVVLITPGGTDFLPFRLLSGVELA
jgi:hypothetical protein